MKSPVKIAIYEPGQQEKKRYFTLRLKGALEDERTVFHQPEKTLVLSGISGNFQVLRRLLFNFSVIDNKNRWTFEDGHLVIMGNCLDDFHQITECLWFIYGLEEKAFGKGGYIHLLPGRNELALNAEDWPNRHPDYALKKRSSGKSYAALYDGSGELLRWLRTKNVMEKIGKMLFTSADLDEKQLQLHPFVTGVNFPVKGNLPGTRSNNAVADKRSIVALLDESGADTIILGNNMQNETGLLLDGKIVYVNADHANERSEALLILHNHYYRLLCSGEKIRLK